MKTIFTVSALAVVLLSGCKTRNPMPTAAEEIPPVIDLPALPKDDGKKDDDKNIAVQPIEVAIALDKTKFSRGEIINFQLSARNVSDRAQTITFTSGQTFDVVAQRADAKNDDPIWRWSMDKMFTQSIRNVTLKPGDEQKFTATWDQNAGAGQTVPRGKYLVRGEFTVNPTLSSPPLEIELVN